MPLCPCICFTEPLAFFQMACRFVSMLPAAPVLLTLFIPIVKVEAGAKTFVMNFGFTISTWLLAQNGNAPLLSSLLCDLVCPTVDLLKLSLSTNTLWTQQLCVFSGSDILVVEYAETTLWVGFCSVVRALSARWEGMCCCGSHKCDWRLENLNVSAPSHFSNEIPDSCFNF